MLMRGVEVEMANGFQDLPSPPFFPLPLAIFFPSLNQASVDTSPSSAHSIRARLLDRSCPVRPKLPTAHSHKIICRREESTVRANSRAGAEPTQPPVLLLNRNKLACCAVESLIVLTHALKNGVVSQTLELRLGTFGEHKFDRTARDGRREKKYREILDWG
ncbi:hypothetical protein RRG08_021260 [Elysia crispata]|uniref:Uncharacterized protein n=1 Tax=Elysia crispata TaxID=231223 RepID=A0AAE0YTS7_9GAST|nr:hypothetical protein RRG08_021260 [Elysia crispata]